MNWTEKQIKYWYGASYQYAILNRWDYLRELLDKSELGVNVKEYLTIDDQSVDKIAAKYGDFGSYRFDRTLELLNEFKSLNNRGRITSEHLLPIMMVDAIGVFLPAFAGNRIVSNTRSFAILWPPTYHYDSSLAGLADETELSEKVPLIVYRGALSGPMEAFEIRPEMRKTSRFEIVKNIYGLKGIADAGISFIPEEVLVEKDYLEKKDEVALVRKPPMKFQEMLKYKYVLCIEGADIATGFGAVLASNSIPVHPYPFCFNSWYFNGLEPWEHFVPINGEGTDVADVYDYCERNPALMADIAANGRAHMQRMLDKSALQDVKKGVLKLWNMKN